MTRRDWYIGVGIIAFVLVLHAVFPRYEWRQPVGASNARYLLRVDNWTGRVRIVLVEAPQK